MKKNIKICRLKYKFAVLFQDPVKFLGTESDQEQNLEFPGFGKVNFRKY